MLPIQGPHFLRITHLSHKYLPTGVLGPGGERGLQRPAEKLLSSALGGSQAWGLGQNSRMVVFSWGWSYLFPQRALQTLHMSTRVVKQFGKD